MNDETIVQMDNFVDIPLDASSTPVKQNKLSCVQFLCGNHADYCGCVTCYGFFPAIIWFIVCVIVGSVVLGVVKNQTGIIVGTVFLCISVVGAAGFILGAAT